MSRSIRAPKAVDIVIFPPSRTNRRPLVIWSLNGRLCFGVGLRSFGLLAAIRATPWYSVGGILCKPGSIWDRKTPSFSQLAPFGVCFPGRGYLSLTRIMEPKTGRCGNAFSKREHSFVEIHRWKKKIVIFDDRGSWHSTLYVVILVNRQSGINGRGYGVVWVLGSKASLRSRDDIVVGVPDKLGSDICDQGRNQNIQLITSDLGPNFV
jgi:hypothetical protein